MIDSKRNMGILRRAQPEQTLEQNLARGRGEQVSATHDMGDALPGIVEHHRELIGMDAIGTAQNEIANLVSQSLGTGSLNTVIKGDMAVSGHC